MRGLTFELRRDQRHCARPARHMICLGASRAWCNAVGPRLGRRVRPRPACHSLDLRRLRSFWCPATAPSHSAAATVARPAFEPPRPLTVRRRTSGGPNEPTEDDGLPRSAVFPCSTAVPSHRFRNLRQRCSDHEPSVLVLSDLAGRCACTACTAGSSTALGLFRVRRRFVAVQSTPTGADSAGALHGFCCEA